MFSKKRMKWWVLLDLVPVSSWIVKSRASSEFPPAIFVMRHSSIPLPGIKAQQLTLPLHGPPPCFSRPPSPSLAICWCPPQSNSLIVVTIKSEHVPDVLPPPRSDLSAHLLHTCYSSHFLITHPGRPVYLQHSPQASVNEHIQFVLISCSHLPGCATIQEHWDNISLKNP